MSSDKVKEENSSKTNRTYKARKVSQFHRDYINGILDRILKGELNTTEVLKLLKEEAIKHDEKVIKDRETIKNIIISLLQDRPEDLKKYPEILKKNIGRRNFQKGKSRTFEIGTYCEEEKRLKDTIIKEVLPKILSGQTTVAKVVEQMRIGYHTLDNIIKEFYAKENDEEGLEQYNNAKRRNRGASLEIKASAKKMRDEVDKYNIVSQSEFLLLSPEEQDRQIFMKVRQEQLNEEKRSKRASLSTEDNTIERIENIKKYFRSKKMSDTQLPAFSEEEIRCMLFRYTTIVSRSPETLDNKIENLTSYEEIDENTAYGMIKLFPAIMGYSTERTKKQLDLLENEGLMDYAIRRPSGLMQSVNLMYALIQYAKESHKTDDLSETNISRIFMSNTILKRSCGTSYDVIKAKYQYDKAEPSDKMDDYIISSKDLLPKGISIHTVLEANNVLNSILKKETEIAKGEKNDRSL